MGPHDSDELAATPRASRSSGAWRRHCAHDTGAPGEIGPRVVQQPAARLIAVLRDVAGEPVEPLCDQLLDHSHPGLSCERTADDIALLIACCEARRDRPAD
jgi:hypothetical protein